MIGYCSGNALAAQSAYHSRHPDRRGPSSKVFSKLHQRLLERHTNEVGPPLRGVGLRQRVLNLVLRNPEVRTGQLANGVGVFQGIKFLTGISCTSWQKKIPGLPDKVLFKDVSTSMCVLV